MGNPSEDSTKLPADKSSGGPAGGGRKHFNNKGPPAAAAAVPISPPPPPTRLVRRRRQTVWAARSHPAQTDFSFRQKGFYELCGYGPFFLPHAQNKRAPFPYRLSRGGGAFWPTWQPPPPPWTTECHGRRKKAREASFLGCVECTLPHWGWGQPNFALCLYLGGWVDTFFHAIVRSKYRMQCKCVR